jgi:Zn-finger nucleic acid-binding protein
MRTPACPACGQHFELRLGEGFRWYECLACAVGWLERSEWAQLVKDEQLAVNGSSRQACPACSRALDRVGLHGIPVLVCAQHGLFVPRASLEALVHALLEANRPGKCPACTGHFADVLALGLRYLRCLGCGGAMVTREAFAGLLHEIATERPPPELGALGPGTRPCPACERVMQRGTLGKERVDVCGAHGTFFDAHELTRALARHAGLAD